MPSSPSQYVSPVFATPRSISPQLSMSSFPRAHCSPVAQTHHLPVFNWWGWEHLKTGTNDKSEWFYWPVFRASQSPSGQSPALGFSSSAAEVAGPGGDWPWLRAVPRAPRGDPARPGLWGRFRAQGTGMKLCTALSREILPQRGPGAVQWKTWRKNQWPSSEELFQSKGCVWEPRRIPALGERGCSTARPRDSRHSIASDTPGTHRHSRDNIPTQGRNTGQQPHLKNCPAHLFIHI